MFASTSQSHRFRTPLRSLTGLLCLLAGSPLVGCNLGGYSASMNSDTMSPQLGVRFEAPQGKKNAEAKLSAEDDDLNNPYLAQGKRRSRPGRAATESNGHSSLGAADLGEDQQPLPDLGSDDADSSQPDVRSASVDSPTRNSAAGSSTGRKSAASGRSRPIPITDGREDLELPQIRQASASGRPQAAVDELTVEDDAMTGEELPDLSDESLPDDAVSLEPR